MAVRSNDQILGYIAELATVLALAAFLTTPALAAPDRDGLCDPGHDATLEITASELTASPVSHEIKSDEPDMTTSDIDAVASDLALSPPVKAALRKIFADSVLDTEIEEAADTEVQEEPAQNSQPQKLSDDGLLPIKKRMYRRDI